MIKFFSNHSDVSFLESFLGAPVEVIKHPYVEPEWTMEELKKKCKKEIGEAIDADILIINGDYSLVSVIVLAREKLGKKTGFICMKKINEPCNDKDVNGHIVHKNVLQPIGIRWLKGCL